MPHICSKHLPIFRKMKYMNGYKKHQDAPKYACTYTHIRTYIK